MLEFRVYGQSLEKLEPNYVVQGSSNLLKARFLLDESWEDFNIIANFSNYNNETVLPNSIIVDKNGICKIPNEVLNSNTIYVSLIGIKRTENDDVTITTNVVSINCIPSGQFQNASNLNGLNVVGQFIYDVNITKEENIFTLEFISINGSFTKTIEVDVVENNTDNENNDNNESVVSFGIVDIVFEDNKLIATYSDETTKKIDLSSLSGALDEERVQEMIDESIKNLNDIDTSDFLTKEKIINDVELQALLKGEPGRNGVDGQDGINGTDGVNGTNGTNGKSNYQIWLDLGNVGTEQEYFETLKGATGADADLSEVNNEITLLKQEIATLKEMLENLGSQDISTMSSNEEVENNSDIERTYKGAVNTKSELPAIALVGDFYDVLNENCQYEWQENGTSIGWTPIQN